MFGNSRCETTEASSARKLRAHLACVAAVLAVSAISTPTTATAQNDTTIGNLPHARICAKDGVTVVGYLTRINADGSAVYMSPSGILVEVSAEGVVDNRAGGTCSGKSLAELRDSGQAREFAD